MDADTILADITQMLGQVIGEDYLLEVDVTMDTAFSGDLELESIEFVALAGLMKEHYGAAVDFVGFLAGKDLHEIIALRVGQVVDHIRLCLEAVGSRG
ncbi:MAG: acyl carrier protein [Acidimicrobiaceae bacterium]|jgi:acyl carrier protein|nr:acyl carrier protein [Acidimicrobiaceae bacterium]MDQ1365249.1 acyl carrier protein [Acidimicrobiaceae bacterium]MDQ1368850.1 acyl carrier protein [Acidimicrobiaceae bacterium]MDQ1376573.1 acyl carrier protein [Acidimicrobiaceae bacterium]MDQ1399706.1 acyl carrier protein [Acidimicrobiaceae bacterium]